METCLAAIRPKVFNEISEDFQATCYEILLVDISEASGLSKEFPRTNLRFDEDAVDVLCSFLYEMTGGERIGLKGNTGNLVSHFFNSRPTSAYQTTLTH